MKALQGDSKNLSGVLSARSCKFSHHLLHHSHAAAPPLPRAKLAQLLAHPYQHQKLALLVVFQASEIFLHIWTGKLQVSGKSQPPQLPLKHEPAGGTTGAVRHLLLHTTSERVA
jgi:hypothetical protein